MKSRTSKLGSGSSIRQYARLDSRIDFIPLKTEAGDTTRYVPVHI